MIFSELDMKIMSKDRKGIIKKSGNVLLWKRIICVVYINHMEKSFFRIDGELIHIWFQNFVIRIWASSMELW